MLWGLVGLDFGMETEGVLGCVICVGNRGAVNWERW